MLAQFLLALTLLCTHSVYAQIVESHVDFTISPSSLADGEIQVAYEWLPPHKFRNKDISMIDLHQINKLSPSNNHMVASKISFISQKSFDNLSYSSMSKTSFIAKMLNSVSIRQKEADLWVVTNRVKAYQVPFKITFDFRFKEVTSKSLGAAAGYLRSEASGFRGTGRERFLVLDMTQFSQLMYRNYSIVYMKELANRETLVVSGVVAGLNKDMADRLFNFPPFSTSEDTMLNNFEAQIMQISKSIQN